MQHVFVQRLHHMCYYEARPIHLISGKRWREMQEHWHCKPTSGILLLMLAASALARFVYSAYRCIQTTQWDYWKPGSIWQAKDHPLWMPMRLQWDVPNVVAGHHTLLYCFSLWWSNGVITEIYKIYIKLPPLYMIVFNLVMLFNCDL